MEEKSLGARVKVKNLNKKVLFVYINYWAFDTKIKLKNKKRNGGNMQ